MTVAHVCRITLKQRKCTVKIKQDKIVFFLPKADLKSLDFVVTRFLNSSSRLATTALMTVDNFSERERRYMSSSVRLSVICRLSVCNVRAPYTGD